MDNPALPLVPGRECGDCTLCCSVPAIDQPDIQKTSMAVCRNVCDKGCAIYETRPQVCRTFFCAWRHMDMFNDDWWRPNISGVYGLLTQDDIPPQFTIRTGVILILVADPLKTIRDPRFIDFVTKGVNSGIPLFLSLPGPRGKQCVRRMLNTPQYFAAAQRSRGEARVELEEALRLLKLTEPPDYVMLHTGADFNS